MNIFKKAEPNSIEVDIRKYKEIDVDHLIKAPWNYKKDDPKQTQKVIAALRKRGQIVNLIVRTHPTAPSGYFEVINGNHRLMGFEAESIPKAICYDYGNISQAEAELIALETNELNIESDTLKLAKLINRVTTEIPVSEVLHTLPYSKSYIQKMAELGKQGAIEVQKKVAGQSTRKMVAFSLPRELAERFQTQVKRFDNDADCIEKCVSYLESV